MDLYWFLHKSYCTHNIGLTCVIISVHFFSFFSVFMLFFAYRYVRPRQLSSVKHSSSFVSLNKVSAHASSPKHFTCLMFVKEARRQLSSPMQETSIGLSVSSNSPLLTNEASEHEPSSTQSMLLQSVNSTPRQRTHLRVVNSREYVA